MLSTLCPKTICFGVLTKTFAPGKDLGSNLPRHCLVAAIIALQIYKDFVFPMFCLRPVGSQLSCDSAEVGACTVPTPVLPELFISRALRGERVPGNVTKQIKAVWCC